MSQTHNEYGIHVKVLSPEVFSQGGADDTSWVNMLAQSNLKEHFHNLLLKNKWAKRLLL